jgi:hypothetical protein
MADIPKQIRARFMEPKETAGATWWGHLLESQAGEINKRFRQAQMLYWSPSVKMPLDLFSYIREASTCFTIGRYLACLVLSSSAVELILNRDSRTKNLIDLRRIGGWATLNNPNLDAASRHGLPVNNLLSEGENLNAVAPVTFVERRNKIAHGEILPLIQDLSDYDPFAEAESLDQLTKSQRFVVEWFNSAPDVQTCRIQNHRWPDEE